MIVMLHKYVYALEGKTERVQASMVVIGDDREQTAMAKTVGLPLGIAAKLVLEGKLPLTGLVIPTVREVYTPLLRELTDHGVIFEEHELP
jgi:saccharopine dehydrogenase-like NADP-dependent oxidoreductase